MQLKNIPIFTILKSEELPKVLYKSRFIIALTIAVILLLSGCSKATLIEQNQDLLQKSFEENILNRDFIVHLASDNGIDITAQFNGFKFKLTKNTFLDGPMTAINGILTITGTWSSNNDYSKLVINLPSPIPGFSFLNREWKFTKKAVPIMELSPWGSTEPKVLHMERL